MSLSDQHVRRAPMGEGGGSGSGGGGSLGGSGAPISHGPAKLPNAVATPASAPAETKPRIQAFSQAIGTKKAGEDWKRKTHANGTGATHVRSFHCKLNTESLDYMDQQINEWLDSHPDYEVKMVTSAVGEWTGKIKEPAFIISVWV